MYEARLLSRASLLCYVVGAGCICASSIDIGICSFNPMWMPFSQPGLALIRTTVGML